MVALGTDKVVITYKDAGNSNYGTAIVGTISGTAISWGSELVFNSADTLFTAITNTGTNKIAICYRDAGNSNYGNGIVYQLPFSEQGIFPATDNIFGVAKTGGTGGQTIEVAYKAPSSIVYSGTITSGSWTGSGPFTKAVTVTGILATDNPTIDLDLSTTDFANVAATQEAWGKIYRAVTSADTITFYATEALAVELKFNAKVVR
jgi:hypothetical protein